MVELEMSLGGFPTTKQEPIKEADKKTILVREGGCSGLECMCVRVCVCVRERGGGS